MKDKKRLLCFLLPGLVSFPALAVDGLLEINHICAVQLGCFSGDLPGYPVTISGAAGNSYRLTGDLTFPDVNTSAIDISASNISLDLNGFAIVRAGCSASCAPVAGTGSGVNILSGSTGVSVKNGSILGVGNAGVLALGGESEIVGLRVRWAGQIGIVANDGSIIRDNIVSGSAVDGIGTGAANVISGNSVIANGGHGIVAGPGSLVQSNVSRGNTGNGLNLTTGSAYRQNVVTGNGGTVNGGVNLSDNSCNGTAICP